jgi:hypothetical protein
MNALIALAFLAQTAQAKLPPQVFHRQQARAEEQLRIRINGVTTTPSGEQTTVEATATVEMVDRSKSGLKRGESITIKFTRAPPKELPPGWTGPDRSGPYLSKGESTCAFLNKRSDGTFSLGAANRSFPSRCTPTETLDRYKPDSPSLIRFAVQSMDKRVDWVTVFCQRNGQKQGKERLRFEVPSPARCRVEGSSGDSVITAILKPTESGLYGCFPNLEAKCIRLGGDR